MRKATVSGDDAIQGTDYDRRRHRAPDGDDEGEKGSRGGIERKQVTCES
jgi:hypothetical protein